MNAKALPPLALVAILLGAVPAAAQERVLTLDEAVRMALDSHPAIQATRLDLVVAREQEGVALAGFLPQLGVAASYNRTTGNYATRPGQDPFDTDNDPATPDWSGNSNDSWNYYNLGVTLNQPIWDFGRTLGAYRAAQAGTEVAAKGIEVSRLDLWNRVVSQYYAVFAAQRLLDVATRLRDASMRHSQVAEAFYKVGSRPKLDMVRAQATAQASQAALAMATERLELAKSALLTAMGLSDRFAFLVAPVEEGAAGPMPDLEAAVAEALKTRPERARLELGIEAAEAARKAAMGEWFPVFSAGASFTDGGTQLDQMAWNWGVGVAMTWPVFSGLATWRAYRAACATVDAMKVRLREFDLGVRAEVEQARLRVLEATSRLQPLRAGMGAAMEALRLAEERYKAGEGNAVEFMDARRGASDAETELVQAEFDVGLAWTALRRALGSLPEAYRAKAD